MAKRTPFIGKWRTVDETRIIDHVMEYILSLKSHAGPVSDTCVTAPKILPFRTLGLADTGSLIGTKVVKLSVRGLF